MTLHRCTVCDQVHSSEVSACPDRAVLVSGTTCDCTCCREWARRIAFEIENWRAAANHAATPTEPIRTTAELRQRLQQHFELKLIAERDSARARIVRLEQEVIDATALAQSIAVGS